jgi:general secretion pathway protein G
MGHIARAVGNSGYPLNLDALVDGVPDVQSPSNEKLFFLRRLPRDPFASSEIVNAADTWGLRSYDSTAQAPKDGKDVFDVYSKSNEIGMNGIPYRQW